MAYVGDLMRYHKIVKRITHPSHIGTEKIH